jgi:hypothetical protein
MKSFGISSNGKSNKDGTRSLLTMNKTAVNIILAILLLTLATLACIGGGTGDDNNSNVEGSPQPGSQATGISPVQATATYGAEQFHLQLTAIAQPEP